MMLSKNEQITDVLNLTRNRIDRITLPVRSD
jgi:hypothetical protein